VGYMSPEQVRNGRIEHRSDIFSFGAMLFEMFSGKRAFHGSTSADTISAILRDEPIPRLLMKGGHDLVFRPVWTNQSKAREAGAEAGDC